MEGQPSEAEWEVVRKSAEKSAALLEKHDESIFSRKSEKLFNEFPSPIPLRRSRTGGLENEDTKCSPLVSMSVHLVTTIFAKTSCNLTDQCWGRTRPNVPPTSPFSMPPLFIGT